MRRQGMAARAAGMVVLTAWAAGQVGCASGSSTWSVPGFDHIWNRGGTPSAWSLPSFDRIFAPPTPLKNPLHVPQGDFETVWNKTVAEVNRHFPIASENRLARTIRSDILMTGTLVEPWTPDSVTFRDRLEATLQTLRKFAVVHIDPAPTGGFLVRVEVYKEMEDLTKPASQPAGRAAFYNDFPVNHTREVVDSIPVPLGWISMGRDEHMEQAILADIRDACLL